MHLRPLATPLAAALMLTALPASAQLSGMGGLSGLMGGMLPNVGSTTTGNAAGVLSYCVKNKLIGSTGGVASTLGALTGRKDVTQSKGFAAGQSGKLVTGNGALSLDDLKGKMKSKVCDLVLQHAKSML